MDELRIGDVCAFNGSDDTKYQCVSILLEYDPESNYPYYTLSGQPYARCRRATEEDMKRLIPGFGSTTESPAKRDSQANGECYAKHMAAMR